MTLLQTDKSSYWSPLPPLAGKGSGDGGVVVQILDFLQFARYESPHPNPSPQGGRGFSSQNSLFAQCAAGAARSFILAALALSTFAPTLAAAQTAPVFTATSTSPSAARVTVNANADRGCFLGQPSATGFPLGVIIDQSGANAGRLRAGLTGAAVTLPDSWCNFPDNALTLRAVPMSATTAPATPPTGFSRLVNYRATAANWQRSGATISVSTTGAANAVTGAAEASGRGAEALYRVADIVVQLDQFIAAGTTLGQSPLMVASNSYQGTVVVSLGPNVLAP